jgi:autotransporter family porin
VPHTFRLGNLEVLLDQFQRPFSTMYAMQSTDRSRQSAPNTRQKKAHDMKTQTRIAAIAAAVAMSLAVTAQARGVLPGETHQVVAGDTPDWWSVVDGSLSVGAGAVTQRVIAMEGSRVQYTQARAEMDAWFGINISDASALQMHDSTIYNSSERALTLGVGAQTRGFLGGEATISNSQLSGLGLGASVNNGRLTLNGSTVEGRGDDTGSDAFAGNGLWLISAGDVTVADGSHVVGEQHGVWSQFDLAGGDLPTGLVMVIDNSTVEGRQGAALHVAADGDYIDPTTVNFVLRNGARLLAGNGNLLEIEATDATVGLRVNDSALTGDIVNTPGSTLDIALLQGASLQGRIDGASTLWMEDSDWLLTGDSRVGTLTHAAGARIVLGDGSAFHTLRVDGDYHGEGGSLLFNSVLAGDDAASDRLVVAGNTSGHTEVAVNNIGGQGAQTVRGIELIDVAGTSAGTFALAGRAVGGQYEYFLRQDGGNWYLRSELPAAPDPCDTDPAQPGCTPVDPLNPVDPIGPVDPLDPVPVPVLRPEPGAYLANALTARDLFRSGYHDRQSGTTDRQAWARVDGARTAYPAVGGQLDVHGNRQALHVGMDVLGNAQGSRLGVMLANGNATSTSTQPLTGYFARGKVSGTAAGVYGTWRSAHADDAYAGFHLDGSLQYARLRNRVEGRGLATERYDARAWQGMLEVGHAFALHTQDSGRAYLEPELQLGYAGGNDSDTVEANGTRVTVDNSAGAFGRIGVRLSGVAGSQDGGAQVQPYLSAHWLRESSPTVRMNDERFNADVPRSRAEFAAGASVRFAGNWSGWAGLALQRSSGYRQTSAQLGMSYRW